MATSSWGDEDMISLSDDEIIVIDSQDDAPPLDAPARSEEAQDTSKLAKEYCDVKAALRELDETAAQLRFALIFRKVLERSASAEDAPLSFRLMCSLLNSGSLLLTIELENKCGFVLSDWSLAVSAVPVRYRTRTTSGPAISDRFISKTLHFGTLAHGQRFKSDILCGSLPELPFILHTHLFRRFCIDENASSVVRINLKPELVCEWNLCSLLPSTSTDRNAAGIPSASVRIPYALVKSLNNKRSITQEEVARSVLPSVIDRNGTDFVIAYRHIEKSITHHMQIHCARGPPDYTLKISGRDRSVVDKLHTDLMAQLIVLGWDKQRIQNGGNTGEGDDGLITVLSDLPVSALYATLINKL